MSMRARVGRRLAHNIAAAIGTSASSVAVAAWDYVDDDDEEVFKLSYRQAVVPQYLAAAAMPRETQP
jgi:hypothetical protein